MYLKYKKFKYSLFRLPLLVLYTSLICNSASSFMNRCMCVKSWRVQGRVPRRQLCSDFDVCESWKTMSESVYVCGCWRLKQQMEWWRIMKGGQTLCFQTGGYREDLEFTDDKELLLEVFRCGVWSWRRSGSLHNENANRCCCIVLQQKWPFRNNISLSLRSILFTDIILHTVTVQKKQQHVSQNLVILNFLNDLIF